MKLDRRSILLGVTGGQGNAVDAYPLTAERGNVTEQSFDTVQSVESDGQPLSGLIPQHLLPPVRVLRARAQGQVRGAHRARIDTVIGEDRQQAGCGRRGEGESIAGLGPNNLNGKGYRDAVNRRGGGAGADHRDAIDRA